MFKVGISNDIIRPYRLATKEYKKFSPQLSESYLLHYYRRNILESLENLIKNNFETFAFFESETFDGYTECFKDECFKDVLNIIEYLANNNNKNQEDKNKKMILEKGITLKKQISNTGKKKNKNVKTPAKFFELNGDRSFFNFLKNNKNNISINIIEKNKVYHVTINFHQKVKFDFFPWTVGYEYKNDNCSGVGWLISPDQYEIEQGQIKSLTFKIIGSPENSFCHLEIQEFASFYENVFILLNNETQWRKIKNEFLMEKRTLLHL